MRKALLKLLSNCLYPFDRHKRMVFRGKHDPTAVYTAKLRKRGVEIGCGTFVYEGTLVRNRHSRIGKFCSIGPDVHIGTGRHPLDALTTNSMVHKNCFLIDGEFSVDPENRVEFEQSLPVTIGNDVWIGMNSIIMDGLTVGDGAVIGAGAIVTRDVPPYAIVAGIPAKVIRYRFDEKTIERLLRARWYDRDMDLIKKLPVGDVDLCLGILEQTEKVEK